MSVEGVTDASARVLAGVEGIKAAYASGAGAQGDTVRPVPADINLTPVAVVTYARFEVESGVSGFERIRHFVNADLWFEAANAAQAERIMLPIISRSIAAFRSKVGLYGEGTIARVPSGGPPQEQNVRGKTFVVFPLLITVLEAGIQTYSTS